MKLWIDTEFNDYKGSLISMALVSEQGDEWYEVLECRHPSQWVAENVIPILGKVSVTFETFQDRLKHFINRFQEIHIISDWPADITHFCDSLITGPGEMIDTPRMTFEIDRTLGNIAVSKIPHNALEDARALRSERL